MDLFGFGVRSLEHKSDIVFNEELEDQSGSSYEIKLKDFDGPFDTLCHLIRKSKYSIEDVKISDITQQYMDYMLQIDELDLERASEFVTMASWLLEIKSKSLLPKPIESDIEDEDPEQALKIQLAEYSLLKEASEKMKELETVDILYRAPDESLETPRFEIKSMNTQGLLSALQRVFLRLEQRAEEIRERHIIKDNYTVEEKTQHIKNCLENQDAVYFFDLFTYDSSKNEVITTFLALLELLKAQYLTSYQQEVFGDILIKKICKNDLRSITENI